PCRSRSSRATTLLPALSRRSETAPSTASSPTSSNSRTAPSSSSAADRLPVAVTPPWFHCPVTFENRMRRDREAQRRASRARSHGLITTAQAVAIGLSQPAVSRRLAAGQWIAVLPGVHCAVDAVPTLYQRLLAAVLWAGNGAVISYRAAGALWGLDVDAGARPEIWTPRHLRHDDVIVHRGVVEPQDIRMVERIPVTSVPRTLIDLAGRLDGEELETILEQALHRGLTTL